MKLLKTNFQIFIIILLFSQLFAISESKMKVFKNDLLLGEISTIQNNKLFSVNDLIAITDSRNFVNEKTQKVIFYINGKKIKVTNQVTFIEIEDNLFQLSSKVMNLNNDYYIPVESFFSILQNLSKPSSLKYKNDEIRFTSNFEDQKMIKTVDLSNEKEKWEFKTIIIDAGHGGKDPGAVGYRGTKEKDIALDVAKRLEKKISRNMNVKVIMTRDEDVFLRLSERTKIANDNKGSLFISIHTNAAEDRRASGFETFLIGLNKNEYAAKVAARENAVLELEGSAKKDLSGEDLIQATMAQASFAAYSETFADLVQKEIKKRVQSKDRGVKQAGFVVLARASMPNVLVELGFISNPSEEKKLRSPQYRDQLATAIYRAIEQYQKTL
ncbi:N-acetylmuramoyl-L-alanine amidase [Candidatus Marinimicrobia bacterium]|nr:N-acetylmuramoyl-L-alanine amidase [Candidatus Neomarinimicrobiota bacterium]